MTEDIDLRSGLTVETHRDHHPCRPAVLAEQGRGIDEPIQTYLPEFNPANDPRRAQVTVRMLLTHTSGIAGTSATTARGG